MQVLTLHFAKYHVDNDDDYHDIDIITITYSFQESIPNLFKKVQNI